MTDAELLFALALGRSCGRRRSPRVRGVVGRPGLYVILANGIRSRRAAFREARRMRDCGGETRPLVVYGSGRAWTVGTRYNREGVSA